MSSKWLPPVVLLVVAGCQLHRFDLTEPRQLTVPLEGVSVLRVEAGAGWLRIDGRPGTTEVRVEGTAHAGTKELLQRIQLTSRRSGDTLIVNGDVPDDRSPVGPPAALDLALQVPPTLHLDIIDRSGETTIRDVGPLRIVHGEGSLDIDGVHGPLDVHDANGDLVVLNVAGDVTIVDAGGGIYLTNVTGSVNIPSDGAGEIQVASVTGDVTVGTKRSGEVRALGVGGNLIVNANGSGVVQYRDVHGKVTIPPERSLQKER
jgi:hypothetical protein